MGDFISSFADTEAITSTFISLKIVVLFIIIFIIGIVFYGKYNEKQTALRTDINYLKTHLDTYMEITDHRLEKAFSNRDNIIDIKLEKQNEIYNIIIKEKDNIFKNYEEIKEKNSKEIMENTTKIDLLESNIKEYSKRLSKLEIALAILKEHDEDIRNTKSKRG